MGATRLFFGVVVCLCWSFGPSRASAQTNDDFLFIHHSVGENWLNDGLRDALLAKDYIDEVNEVNYGVDVDHDSSRPDSLQDLDPGMTPGDHTDIFTWIYWFNDYLEHLRTHDCNTGGNRIIMFKSCYPTSDVYEDGTPPGDPFDSNQTLANYRAIYRHPDGAGQTYSSGSITYRALNDVFAANPDVLFIVVTSPSRIPIETCNNWADRGRVFASWLANDWLTDYNAAHPTLKNLTVFNFFDMLAYANDFAGTEDYAPGDGGPAGTYPVRNMTKPQYRTGDSHPNSQAGQDATALFATNTSNPLDIAYNAWLAAQTPASVDWRRWVLHK